ncbi:MAG: chromate efflux transporter [Terracidiphilus sp.]|jgi:chromate transporter
MGVLSGKSAPGEMGEIVRLFLRLGFTAFGGPAAHLGLMESETVERRGWLSRERFLDLVGACNLLPGPGSTQVAMALGYGRAGWMGLVTAGVCFILPASLATLALAWAYVRYSNLPQAQGLLYGAKPVMVAVIVQAILKLGRTAFRSWALALTGLACFAAALAGTPPLAVLLASGGLALLAAGLRSRSQTVASLTWVPLGLGGVTAGAAGLTSLFLVFLKLGVVVFGSGYVLLAFLKADLVDRLHWITEPQLLDAITAGQVTPGPVFATATFLGYLLRGWAGAAMATAAIFLPSFAMAGLVGALAGHIRKSKPAAAFLDGVNAASVALMASVALALGRGALVDGFAWAVGAASGALLVRYRVNATWLILGGAGLGILVRGLA